MGKIRVEDLAKKMGIPNQDLVFKLKSIGVRLDEKDPRIDADIIKAVLEGKSMRLPREVILRDKEAQATAPQPRRRPPTRRMPTGPVRPGRRRMIQRVEPRIKTIPTSEPEKKQPTPEPAAPAATGAPAAPAAPTASTASTAPAAPATRKPAPAAPPRRGTPSPRAKPPVIETPSVRAPDSPTVSDRGKRRSERRKEATGDAVVFKDGAPSGPITVAEGMTVRDFAEKLGIKSKDLIAVLMRNGIMASINHVIEPAMAVEIAEGLGVDAMEVTFEEEVQLREEGEAVADDELAARAPVVTIMGHVDHGKTTLLDTIRSSKITESEFGGITQHIGAYQVETDGRKVVFLDTPGHEAFTLMRARGAKVTDIVVLVVAADDGVMPQTIEAIDHAKAAKVPIIIAVNKMDKAGVNPDRVKKELADHGVAVEEWGGDTVAVEVSALKNQGIDDLLEMLLLNADLLELRANPKISAHGVVLEARKEAGRGIIATVLVQNGTLSTGDVFVAGSTWGRVRSMNDDHGKKVGDAEPATPVEVTGFDSVPEAGDLFQVVEEESKARSIAEFRQQETRDKELRPTATKISLDQLFDQIQEGEVKELPVVLKADVQGSVEVLSDTLQRLSTEKVKIQIIRAGVGAINTNDVLLASASNAIVVGFNVRPEKNAADLADKEQVDIRLHTVIYELNEEIRNAMTGLLEPTFREVSAGRAEVRETFSVPKLGNVAGCHVVEGVIPRNAGVRLLRDNVVIYEGTIASLRRFKDDVGEVRTGFDCGIRLERYQDVKPGDFIEAYTREEVAPSL